MVLSKNAWWEIALVFIRMYCDVSGCIGTVEMARDIASLRWGPMRGEVGVGARSQAVIDGSRLRPICESCHFWSLVGAGRIVRTKSRFEA